MADHGEYELAVRTTDLSREYYPSSSVDFKLNSRIAVECSVAAIANFGRSSASPAEATAPLAAARTYSTATALVNPFQECVEGLFVADSLFSGNLDGKYKKLALVVGGFANVGLAANAFVRW